MENLESRLQKGFIEFTQGHDFKARIYPDKIILKNDYSEIRLSYDKLLEKYIVSISTDRILDKIKLRGDEGSEVWLSYDSTKKLHILSMSTKSLIHAENNVRNLVKHYSRYIMQYLV